MRGTMKTNYKSRLLSKISSREAHVAIVGLGYVGLPLAVVFAEAGYRVTGIDVDGFKVDSINRGSSYIEDVSSESVQRLVGQGKLSATTDFSVLQQCDAVSICVPTPLRKTGDPDISYIISATEQIAKYLHPGMIVVLESTTYPGTTTEAVLPMLSESGHNFKVGEDFFLAFSPERVDPGRPDWTTKPTPKVIGGAPPACLEVSLAYYGNAMDTMVAVGSTEAAEMVKL